MLLLSVAGVALSQTIGEAEAKYSAKDYSASGKVYEQVFKKRKASPYDYYNAACAWALAGEHKKATMYLRLAVAEGYANLEHLQQDTDLANLRQRKQWVPLVQELKQKVAAVEANYNQPLKVKLEEMYETDQQVRQKYLELSQSTAPDAVAIQQAIQEMQQADRKNQQEVLAILEQQGWPSRSQVGSKAQMAAFLVIQHAPLEVQEKYLPLMREAAAAGELELRNLALLEDRVLMRNGKPQLYGSQIEVDSAGNQTLYPIADEPNVNQRRAEVGLPPLEEYLAHFGMQYTLPAAKD